MCILHGLDIHTFKLISGQYRLSKVVIKLFKYKPKKKANRYIDMIKSLKERRISLAYDLTETLSDLERKSGIFLVKPLYSYQGL